MVIFNENVHFFFSDVSNFEYFIYKLSLLVSKKYSNFTNYADYTEWIIHYTEFSTYHLFLWLQILTCRYEN
jgi:hypothetical protein